MDKGERIKQKGHRQNIRGERLREEGKMVDKQISEKDEFIKIIREFLNDNFLFGDDKELEEETSFLDNGILDSTGILELVAILEEKFGILIEDDEIVPENLDSLKNITTFLQWKKHKV